MAQLQYAGLAAWPQHTAHLSQALLKVGEIADAEGGGHGVECVVAKRQVKTVLTLEMDGGGKTFGAYLPRPTSIMPSDMSAPVTERGWSILAVRMAKSPVPVAMSSTVCG